MSNPEHVAIVRQGKQAILRWRAAHPGIRLDLSSDLERSPVTGINQPIITDLSGVDLRGADLSGAILDRVFMVGAKLEDARLEDASLVRANLSTADLLGARLGNARLWGTELSEANLAHTSLRSAALHGAELNDAILWHADLFSAELVAARLHGTDFRDVTFGHTTFADVDLSAAENLTHVRHAEPSTVGVDTLYRSAGNIPAEFLRGCGLPQEFIDYIPALIGALEPVQFYSCFISYSHKDEDFARRLHSRLVQEKLRVWYAPEDMKGGQKLIDQIDQAIRIHDKLLLVLSPESMQSNWVATEVERTRRAEREQGEQKLFPISICPFEHIKSWTLFDSDSGRDLAKDVRSYHIPDFSHWKDHDAFEKSFTKLMSDLKAERGPGDET